MSNWQRLNTAPLHHRSCLTPVGGLTSATRLERRLPAALAHLQNGELLGNRWVDSDGVIEISLGGTSLESNGQTLQATIS